ncbi:biotin-dependent carboxyltransferase family protein [Priestia koreensis]|uniref:Carboxyltransferase domain-containing protein n=1 Tax=Priestia koreensis TaxID=284581 RepID=A0A0M0LHJ1_9BACI|nr:biotin-dependent carboxyltransferase family protein [Priestia koreensis]KOO50387.1 hypothetical protein AMD01_01115 [Priestia koreensis]
MRMKMVRPGLLTTVQDTGRIGYQQYGITTSGPMDQLALRVANLLAGNEENAGALEITLMGPKISFLEDTLIALTGADLSPVIDGKEVGMWRPVLVKAGSLLQFGIPKSGCRAYLAIGGGIQTEPVMNSRSTYVRAGIGGVNGRALQAGDELTCGSPSDKSQHLLSKLQKKEGEAFVAASWTLSSELLPTYKDEPSIQVVEGPEYAYFTEESQQQLTKDSFQVTPQSDRMGYRLKGTELKLRENLELVSSAVTFGTVQVPPDGNPIVLVADHQTTGGYPRIAQVASVDFSKLAQVAPGKSMRFTYISLEEAQKAYIQRETTISTIKKALQFQFN